MSNRLGISAIDHITKLNKCFDNRHKQVVLTIYKLLGKLVIVVVVNGVRCP